MNKLKLRLEDLQIESFHTTTVRKEKGTVVGEQDPCTCPTRCDTCTCPGCPTCWESCNGTCEVLECDPSLELGSCLPDCTVSDLPTNCDGNDCS